MGSVYHVILTLRAGLPRQFDVRVARAWATSWVPMGMSAPPRRNLEVVEEAFIALDLCLVQYVSQRR